MGSPNVFVLATSQPSSCKSRWISLASSVVAGRNSMLISNPYQQFFAVVLFAVGQKNAWLVVFLHKSIALVIFPGKQLSDFDATFPQSPLSIRAACTKSLKSLAPGRARY